MVVRSTSWSENRLKWKAVFVNLFFLRHEKAQKNEEKLSPHPRLKTNYSNNNEKLMAAVRNAFCALRNVKEINWVILCFPRLLYPLLQHSLFVHMQNSRASRKTYLVACQKVFFFLCCVFFSARPWKDERFGRRKSFREQKNAISNGEREREGKLACGNANFYQLSARYHVTKPRV